MLVHQPSRKAVNMARELSKLRPTMQRRMSPRIFHELAAAVSPSLSRFDLEGTADER
jgi:hypothetical protein